MHKNRERLKVLLFPLFCAGILLALAGVFSRSHLYWRGGVYWFDMFWIAIPPLALSALTLFFIWRRIGTPPWGQWLWFFVPHFGSVFLYWKTEAVLKEIATGNTHQLSIAYVFWSCAFVAEILLWIVGFPYEEIWGPSRKSRAIWKAILSIMAVGITGFALQRSLEIVHRFGPTIDFQTIEVLQSWMQRVTVAIYVFLVIRVLLPLTISIAAATLEPPNPQHASKGYNL